MFYDILGICNEQVAKDAILKIAKNAQNAQEIVKYLSTVDWQLAIDESTQEKKDRITSHMDIIQKAWITGGGYCDECNELSSKLYYWPFASRDTDNTSLPMPKLIPEQSMKEAAKEFDEWAIKERELDRSKWNTTFSWYCHSFCKRCLSKQQSSMKVPWQCVYHICDICDRVMLGKLYTINYSRRSMNCCFHCIEQATEKQFSYCAECGKKTVNILYGELCYDCKVLSPYQWQVTSQIARAKASGNPATLTLKEWETSVAYFGNKCAYCRNRPFEVLEHYIPIILGGGTTFENCVPACQLCNSKKGGTHPDKLSNFFPSANLEIIKRYLSSEKQITIPITSNCRALALIHPK